ncbi:MAG TPA: uracil-DNA glycosylase [Chthoniobacterales bacterium]|jgi:uracil-DNA glycosylase|nr:uracil-DNA glycosylase [Chthoniobacterales bacterium]
MRLMQFPHALETVLETLERMRNEGARQPCASRSVIDALKGIPVATRADVLEGAAPSAPVPVELMGHDSACPSKGQNAGKLAAIKERVAACVKCPNLASSRTQTVFGVGNPDADLMFVGEAPGADEDAQGEPFVGRAGQLLTKIIKAMGFAREEVYIANILKCRPDTPGSAYGNRPPTPSEMQTCRPYLMEQIDIIKPKVLVALGATAVEGLLGNRAPMHQLRGRWHSFNGTPLMVTYHPAYLLRNQAPSEKRKVWEDMMQVLERLEKPISEKQRNYFL